MSGARSMPSPAGVLAGSRVGRRRRSRWAAGLGVLLAIAAMTSGCATGHGGVVDDWSRSYLSTYERVFEAALDSVEDIDFYLATVDRERGRIQAEASVRREDEITLIVNIDERSTGISVNVMARSLDAQEGLAPGGMSAAVGEFLRNLDARLEGRAD